MESCNEFYLTSGVDRFTSEKIVNLGFFDEKELAVFSELIQQRRPLPVFHGAFWRCFSCNFCSDDFEKIAAHLLESHEPAPFVLEEVAVEQD